MIVDQNEGVDRTTFRQCTQILAKMIGKLSSKSSRRLTGQGGGEAYFENSNEFIRNVMNISGREILRVFRKLSHFRFSIRESPPRVDSGVLYYR